MQTRKYPKEKSNRATYNLLRKCRNNHLCIDCTLDMYEKSIMPIMLYGSEIWGFENPDCLELNHLKFCKSILRLKNSTPNFMIYGELGRFPLSISIKVRMIKFWCKIVTGKRLKFSSLFYNLLYIYYTNYGFESKWLLCIKQILDDCGLSFIWQ